MCKYSNYTSFKKIPYNKMLDIYFSKKYTNDKHIRSNKHPGFTP